MPAEGRAPGRQAGLDARPEGFAEAEVFELEKEGGALDLVAEKLVEIIAEKNRRKLGDNERALAVRELRGAL